MSSIYTDISNLYTKGGFMARYSGDLFIVIIICLLVCVGLMYFWIKNNIEPILADWNNQKCNPAVIPFAGWINAPSGMSSFDFTSKNFEQCTQTILKEITEYAFLPIYYAMNIITSVFHEVSESVNSTRAMFDKVRTSMNDQGSDINSRILNIMLPLTGMMNKVGAIFGKAQGTLISGIYTLYGGFLSMESLFLYIYELVINLLWIIFSFIIACFAVGWLFPPTLAAGMAAAAFLSILLIPLVVFVIILTSMSDVFVGAGMKPPPMVPKYVCFSGDTLVRTKYDGVVKMSEMYLGQELYDNSIVTAFMKSSSIGCDIYNIDGIIVTGTHLVFEPTRGWVQSCNHSRSIPVADFSDEYVYCIGTNSKEIRIGEHIFMDWDEINDEELSELYWNPELSIPLPKDFTKYDMHTYLETGLHPDTIVYLYDGSKVHLKDVKVEDKLLYGETVKTIVTIQSGDVECYDITGEGIKVLSATKNTEVVSLDNRHPLIWTKSEPPLSCNHLITDKGGFKIPGLFIGSYNRGVDRYLQEDKKHGGLDEYLLLS